MSLRKTLGASVLAAVATIGCSSLDELSPDEGPNNGCTGACNPTDAGTTLPDGGMRSCPAPDSQGRGPVGIVRNTYTQGQSVTLEHVVVTAVDDLHRGSQGDSIAQFWVVDPCFPREGLWIDKNSADTPTTYVPQLGDELTIQGLFRHINRTASDISPSSTHTQVKTRSAYRPTVKNSDLLSGVSGTLSITQTGTVPVPQDLTVPTTFGNAQGGAAKPNADYGGARVHIPGPITLTNPDPLALKQHPDLPENGTYLGFEVTGGVLVSNDKAFGVTFDGGTSRCDWRALVKDGGTVNFPNGIRGVWDTYSHVPCADGGFTSADGGTSSNCTFSYRDAGYVPGTSNDYTYILYPQDCATDLPWVAGSP